MPPRVGSGQCAVMPPRVCTVVCSNSYLETQGATRVGSNSYLETREPQGSHISSNWDDICAVSKKDYMLGVIWNYCKFTFFYKLFSILVQILRS